MRILNSCVV